MLVASPEFPLDGSFDPLPWPPEPMLRLFMTMRTPFTFAAALLASSLEPGPETVPVSVTTPWLAATEIGCPCSAESAAIRPLTCAASWLSFGALLHPDIKAIVIAPASSTNRYIERNLRIGDVPLVKQIVNCVGLSSIIRASPERRNTSNL